jgi:O-methyltransferase
MNPKRVIGTALTSNRLTAWLVPLIQDWRRTQRDHLLYRKYRDFTMVPRESFIDNLGLCRIYGRGEGAIVECGVWRGGMIAAIAEVLGPERHYYLFDSFDGLPPANPEKDGKRAVRYQADPTGLNYHDNCRAEMAWAERAMGLAGAAWVKFVRGWYKNTLPTFSGAIPIAVLRLDADWYDSTMECLAALYPSVVSRGVVLIDDYFAWDGCAKAVHDYLAKHGLPDRIRQSPSGVAYIIKGS